MKSTFPYLLVVSATLFGTAGVFVVWGLVIAMILGWAMNIFQVAMLALAGSEITLLLLVKIVGIFAAPLGGVMGWVG